MSLDSITPPSLPPRRAPKACPPAGPLADLVSNVEAVLENDQSPANSSPRPASVIGDEILVLQRQINRLHAALLERLGEFDAIDGARAHSGVSTSSWLRHRAGLPARYASELVRAARTLRTALPLTAQAIRGGELTVHHAHAIVNTTQRVGDAVAAEHHSEVTREVETAMVHVGRSVDAGSLHGFGRRVRDVIDPDGTLADANRAYERRWLTAAKTLDGMVNIEGLLDADSGALLLTVLASEAMPQGSSDTRTAGQRRADALVHLCQSALNTGSVVNSGGVSPHLLVTTSLEALMKMPGHKPAALEWAGSIPNESLQRIACDATITRVLVDPHGMPLDVGRASRVVPAAIRSALIVRDDGCVADGCDRPVAWTEAHHIRHWVDGGPTSLDNLVLLCRTHHRRVHEDGWRLERLSSCRLVLHPPPINEASPDTG